MQTTLTTHLEGTLRDIGIPPRPLILDQIGEAAKNEEPDFAYIGRLISSDVALVASLIKLANSPFFGIRQKLHTIHDILMMLGIETTSRAIAGIALRRAFPTTPVLERFWDASAKIARLSGWLALQYPECQVPAEDAYTFGLFRDCGIPILARHYPQYFSILKEANQNAGECFTLVEDRHLPTNHTQVGYLLGQSWWLKGDTSLAIKHHHNLPMLHSDTALTLSSRYQIALAQFAEFLVQSQTNHSYTEEWVKLGPDCLSLLNISEDEIKLIQADAILVIAANH